MSVISLLCIVFILINALEVLQFILQQELVNKVTPVCQPALNVLLFGSQELSNCANKYVWLFKII